ncbi:MAG: diguanylate cyclase [Alphaproteobacteria bacterium]|nr:diguanylate cyclase [Alphaproteobacteria bacterium]
MAPKRKLTEMQLADVAAASPVVLYIIEQRGEGFEPVWVSDNVARITGHSPEDCLGDPRWWIGAVHPEDRAAVLARTAELRAKGQLVHEYRLRHKHGHYIWIRDELRTAHTIFGPAATAVGAWMDISERRDLETALHDTQDLFYRAFHSNPTLMALTHPDTGEHFDVNDTWLATLKYERDDVIGASAFELDLWADANERARILAEHAARGRVRDMEARLRARDGTVVECLISTEPIEMAHRNLVLWTAADITERNRIRRELETLAHTDPLTGLANRHTFDEVLQRAHKRASRHRSMLGVLALDVDGFKAVNDTLGHPAGDELLIQIAGRLRACVRETDTVARLGGDEFFVVLEDLHARENASAVAEQIVEELSQTFTLSAFKTRVTVSVGIALARHDGASSEELVKQADQALYAMKRQGKNGYLFHDALADEKTS